MVRIDFLVFGYRKIFVSQELLGEAAGLLLRAKIPSIVRGEGIIFIREKDYSTVLALLSGKFECAFSECLGIYGAFQRIKYKRIFFAALAISVLLTAASTMLVWDVRVEGNERLPDALIISNLEKSGFKVGSFWFGQNLSGVEADCLNDNRDLSWININRRGTVAYVTVIESESNDVQLESSKFGYANIIASRDCVIEEITVKNGSAAVRVGDTVKKGDLLISGVIYGEFGTKYCHAEGTVYGRVRDEIVVQNERKYTLKTKKGEKINSMSLKIFNFKVNIFKKYGKQSEECDIIKDVKTYSLLGKCKLPLEIYTESLIQYESTEAVFSDAELVFATSKKLQRKLNNKLRESDLLRLRTEGEFTDEGYIMRCEAVYLTDVGEKLPFKIE